MRRSLFEIIRESQDSYSKQDRILEVVKVLKYYKGGFKRFLDPTGSEYTKGIPENSIEATELIYSDKDDVKRGDLFLPLFNHFTQGIAPGDLALVIYQNLKNSAGYWIRQLTPLEFKNFQSTKKKEENNEGEGGGIDINKIEKFIIDRNRMQSYSFYETNNLLRPFCQPVDGKVVLEYAIKTKENEIHNGIDIQPYINEVVYASFPGQIVKVSENEDIGKYIKLKEGKLIFIFGHVDNILVKEGDEVYMGQRISGLEKKQNVESHLHLEVFFDNQLINPRPLFNYSPVLENVNLYRGA